MSGEKQVGAVRENVIFRFNPDLDRSNAVDKEGGEIKWVPLEDAAIIAECPLMPGSLVLVRPWFHLLWCWRSRSVAWPTIAEAIMLVYHCLLSLITFCSVTHAIQYLGRDEFVCTRIGRVRKIAYSQLPAGLLDTSVILQLKRAADWSPEAPDLFWSAVKELKVTRMDFVWRGLIRKGWSKPWMLSAFTNEEAIARGWKSCVSIDLHKECDREKGGLAASDFLSCNRFVRCLTMCVAPVSVHELSPKLDEWLEKYLPPFTYERESSPKLVVFGPFPPQYYHRVKQMLELERANDAERLAVHITPVLKLCRETNHLYFSAENDKLRKLSEKMHQTIPHLDPQPANPASRLMRPLVHVCKVSGKGLQLDPSTTSL